MKIIQTPGKADLCLVGPVKLPVQQGELFSDFPVVYMA